MRKLNRAKRAKSLEPDMFYVPRGELVVQLRDSTDSLLVEKRQKITISAISSWQKLVSELTVEQDGNLTVFIDNQDTEPVYFDNLELRVASDPTLVITQEHHYYPFGMNLSGIERQGDLMYQFNGMVEKEQAFGLELYETPFRSYDAQLGRFWQVEPLADIYCGISMYQFGYNNPVSFNDPSGLSCDPIFIVDMSTPIGLSDILGTSNEMANRNRSSPYSMGGTPGQGPARITIVNYNKNDTKDLNIAKKLVEDSLEELGICNVSLNIVSSGEGIGQEHVTGINATYLFGNTTNNSDVSVEGQDYRAMYTLAKHLEPSNHDYSMWRSIYLKTFSYGTPEQTSGWKYNSGGYMESFIGGQHKNIGVVATEYISRGVSSRKSSILDGDNVKISRAEMFAITILHMMGHTAGLKHPSGMSPMLEGDKLSDLLQAKATYNSIVHPTTNTGHSTWSSFVRNYFSSTWNGDPTNAKSYQNYSQFMKLAVWESIFQTAYNNGWIQGSK